MSVPSRSLRRLVALAAAAIVFTSGCTMFTWGANGAGQLGLGAPGNQTSPALAGARPQGAWIQFATGTAHSCGVRADSTLWCWGDGTSYQLGNDLFGLEVEPVQVGTDPGWSSVAAGTRTTCAVRHDGTLWCWGDAFDGSGAVPGGRQVGTDTDWVGIDVGTDHACGVKASGTLWCWGDNGGGQLGIGSTSDQAAPVQVGSSSNWSSVATGEFHTCATRTNDGLACWGANASGQVGDGTFSSRDEPVQIGSTTWESVSAGSQHTCAVGTDESMWCWGLNVDGQLGDGSVAARNAPVQVGTNTNWRMVDAGAHHTCGVRKNDTARCWGANADGQIGDGTTSNRFSPTLADLSRVFAVSAGGGHTCAVDAFLEMWCWGANAAGQIGDESVEDRPFPTPVEPSFDDLAAGGDNSCRIRSDATLWCWGDNTYGQLGLGDVVDRDVPTQVGVDRDWSRVDTGDHTCAIKTDATLWCWGRNDRIQTGEFGDATTPRQVVVGGNAYEWDDLDVGALNTCATQTDATLWCWGPDDAGQRGDGVVGGIQAGDPTQIGTTADWAAVAVGGEHVCAVKTSGELWCWGSDSDGQLGNGGSTGFNGPTPMQIAPATTWANVTAGAAHTCASTIDRTLACWGLNDDGQLGDGTTTTAAAPVPVGFTGWTTIAAGAHHTCAFRNVTGNDLWCWGDNGSGQLGDGTLTDRTSPAQIGAGENWLLIDAGTAHTVAIAI